MKLVSVIVPVYNVEEYIEECLESVLQQTYTNLEIICVNDCTQDNSMNVVKRMQKQDSRVIIVSNKTNRGLGGARNAGLEVATGTYVLFVDSDDKLSLDAVASFVETIEETEAPFVRSAYFEYREESSQYSKMVHAPATLPEESNEVVLFKTSLDYLNYYPSAWAGLWRLDIIQNNNIRFPEKLFYEDHLFYCTYCHHSKWFAYCNKPLYYYRVGREGGIVANSTSKVLDVFVILSQIEDWAKNALHQDGPHFILKLAIRLLWERTFVLRDDYTAIRFYRQSARYFSKYSLEELSQAADDFITNDELIKLSSSRSVNLKLLATYLQFITKPLVKIKHHRLVKNGAQHSKILLKKFLRPIYSLLVMSCHKLYTRIVTPDIDSLKYQLWSSINLTNEVSSKVTNDYQNVLHRLDQLTNDYVQTIEPDMTSLKHQVVTSVNLTNEVSSKVTTDYKDILYRLEQLTGEVQLIKNHINKRENTPSPMSMFWSLLRR